MPKANGGKRNDHNGRKDVEIGKDTFGQNEIDQSASFDVLNEERFDVYNRNFLHHIAHHQFQNEPNHDKLIYEINRFGLRIDFNQQKPQSDSQEQHTSNSIQREKPNQKFDCDFFAHRGRPKK